MPTTTVLFLRLLLSSVLLLTVLPHPLPQTTSRNISVRHEKRKRIKSDVISGLQPNLDEPSQRRNSHKHVLINNRTMQILGERVQQILNDSQKWGVKESLNKSAQNRMNFDKILQDRRIDSRKKSTSGRNRIYSTLGKGRSSEISPPSASSNESILEMNSSSNVVENSSLKLEEITQKEINLNESQFHQESDINSEISSALSSETNPGDEVLTDYYSSNLTYIGNDSKDDLSYDYSYDLEMLNLRGYTSEGSQLSGLLRDLLDRLSSSSRETDQDSTPPCQMWVDCRWKLQEVLIRNLPSCPCTYPSVIFYDDRIWDQHNQRFFRWKDASGASERLDVYKPGAKNCVRSIATDLYSISAQHCCYDSGHVLLTRGSGAGSPNLVSPDISPALHYRIDILPWHHCKGDFTRFNKVRPPNNGNKCLENPSEEEYLRQIDTATSF